MLIKSRASHWLQAALALALFFFATSLFATSALAAPPVVSVVPANPTNPAQLHDIIAGRATTLKGAVDEASIGSTWTWDPGDGSDPVAVGCTGNVDANPVSNTQLDDPGYNPYWAVWCDHTYAGAVGTTFIATLTVDNGVDPPVSNTYPQQIVPSTLDREVNAAIDEALWHMHRNQFRFDGTVTGTAGGAIPMGRWDYPQTFGQAEVTVSAASVNALEANGRFEGGPASDPYTDTVARGLKYVIARLGTAAIAVQPAGDPDVNGNGLGIGVVGTVHVAVSNHHSYKLGMITDSIVASGTPGAIATTGPANVIGRTYGDIVQDMVDYFAYCQSNVNGGWDYTCNAGGLDNSIHGWSAIGLIAAQDDFGATIPGFVKTEFENALELSDIESDVSTLDGRHGYRNTGLVWGPYAGTAAAQVGMDLSDIEASTGATPDERWVRTENYIRRDFNFPASGDNIKNYYYAMFNIAKAMRLARPAPVVDIGTQVGAADGGVGCGPNAGCAAGGPNPFDWYNDPVNGLARTVVDYQILTDPNIGGFTDRPGNFQGSNQDDHNTPWATQILTPTLFTPAPVCIATASPNPGAVGQLIDFDGSGSFHQNPGLDIVLYEWDLDNDGNFDDAVGSMTATSFGALGTFPVGLKVTDDDSPAVSVECVVNVEITIPPHPPTADAGGPYQVCIDELPVILDGTGSFDVDEGQSEDGNPPFDTITAYEWELNPPPFNYDDAVGSTTSFDPGGTGTFFVGLQVTDNTAAAFPSSGEPDLTDNDDTTVTVLAADDPACVVDQPCDEVVTARPKTGKIQLVWNPVGGATQYNILRSVQGPGIGFAPIATGHVTSYATYLDTGLLPGEEYWYIVEAENGGFICATEVVSAVVPAGPICGIGFELAFLLPPLAWLRRRMRSRKA